MNKIITKSDLINALKRIRDFGWVENARPRNAGGVGNTLEDLLGIDENNLPIPNASEWELKSQRIDTSSLTTLFHMEPSPRAFKFVPKILLLSYGWKHELAGIRYPENELSFRQTINAQGRTDRGFGIIVNYIERKISVSFDSKYVSERHKEWLESIKTRVGLEELNPAPYWGFDDLFHKAGTKLINCFFVQAQVKKENKKEYFHYSSIYMLQKLSLEKFIKGIENELVLIDFDARTGHNHGTKFRLRQEGILGLYEEITVI